MAVSPSADSLQVINVDIALERQKILREKLGEFFQTLSDKSKQKKRLVYTLNSDSAALDQVLKLNEEADALFTSFNYDAQAATGVREAQVVSTIGVLGELTPQLRYPRIAEFQKLVDTGFFRHRKLILVGDIYGKIGQCLKSKLPVQVTVFSDQTRAKVTPVPITSLDRITPMNDPGDNGAIPVARISSIQIADIPFHGIINMPEVENRFLLRDPTVLDTVRKLFVMPGVKEVLTKQRLAEEKLTFVRSKRVLVVLDSDLERIVSERLLFDGMQQVTRVHTLDEATALLSTGKSQGIAQAFERQGYDLIFDLLSQEERDKFMLALLGNRLPEFLEREIKAVKANAHALESSDLDSLLYSVPQEVLDMVLVELQRRSYDRFLALIPMKIRDQVILQFLASPLQVQAAWRGIGEAEKKDIYDKLYGLILGYLNLMNSALFKRKFPNLTFEFNNTYDSANLARMSAQDRQSTFSLLVKSLEKAKLPPGAIAKALQPPEIERLMLDLIAAHPAEFYNRLIPLVRKQIWLTVGREYRDQIVKALHVLDKIEIIKGVKESSLAALFDNPKFLEFARSDKDGKIASQMFLTLKKINTAESKSALLKRILTAADWKDQRMRVVPTFLCAPENQAIYAKLADRIDSLEFRFDSLVCAKVNYAKLRPQAPLKNAVVTLVDNLVDSSLFKMLDKGAVSLEEYSKLSANVEQEIQAIRKKMAAQALEDPVGTYVLETMLTLNEMSNLVISGKLTPEVLKKLDTRAGMRQKLLAQLKGFVQQLDDFLGKANQQLTGLNQKVEDGEKRLAEQTKLADEAYNKAKALMAESETIMKLQGQANEDRKAVALTQKQLSEQFFGLIQPLILDKLKELSGPLGSLLRFVGFGKRDANVGGQRIIFKFTEAELQNILRYKIVFCTKDEILLQFIATCLRIDKLEDSLFTLATPDTLGNAKDIDILFYGPGHTETDFEGRVKEGRMVQFADNTFEKRLTDNERLKSKTRQSLGKVEKAMQDRKAQMETVTKEAKAHREKLRALSTTVAGMKEERNKLKERVDHNAQRKHHYQGELDLLESKLAHIDAKFQGIKDRITALMNAGPEQADEKMRLVDELRNELMALNRDLARLMFVKGVKDVGDFVSKTTQNQISQRIDQRERFDTSKSLAKIAVADDGSGIGQTLKRIFTHVGSTYLRVPEANVDQLTLKRLAGRLEAEKIEPAYPIVALFADQPQDGFEEIRNLVKKVYAKMPDAYQIVLCNMGDISRLPPNSPALGNILAIKERAAVVNAWIVDYSEPKAMLRLLQEKAPRG